MNKIIFFCDANESVGLGHLSRCINLARKLRELSLYDICFIGLYSDFASNLIKNYNFQFINQELINAYFDFFQEEIDAVIVDNYHINQSLVNSLCCKSYKSIFIDDFCNLDLSKASLIINFTIDAFKYNYNNKNALLGTEFFLAKPELLDIRTKNILSIDKRKSLPQNVLIFLSGISLKKNIEKLLYIISNSFGFSSNIYFISNQEYNDISKIKILPFSFNIEEYYKKADVIICGGGLTKYEAAYTCIPNASIAVTNEQENETKNFANYELTYDLGSLSENPNKIQEKLFNFIDEVLHQDLVSKFILSSQKHFHTNSLEQVANKILEIL